MESKLFFPPYIQRGDFLWPELWFISKHIILWGRGGEKTHYFFGIYFTLPRLFLIFQIICGMSALPDFSCEEEKKEEKSNSYNSLGEQHGIKHGKGGTSDTFHLPPANTVQGRLDHRLHAARNECRFLFSKVTYFPQNLILIFAVWLPVATQFLETYSANYLLSGFGKAFASV